MGQPPRSDEDRGRIGESHPATVSKWRWRFTGIAVVSAGVIGLLWAFLEFQPFRHDAISFEVAEGCTAASYGSKADRAGDSFVQKWENGDLIVRASERSHCDQVDSVSAQVIAGHLFLRLKYGKPGRPPAACLCRHNTIIRVKGVENRIYSIHRVGIARIGG